MAKNETPSKSRRDAFRERLASSRPDLNMDDEEAFYGALDEDYTNFDNERTRYNENQEKVTNMFNRDPMSAAFINRMADGEDPYMLLVEEFGDDIVDAVNDPEKREALAEKRKIFAEKVAQSADLERQFDENLPASIEALQEEGFSEDEIDKGMEIMTKALSDLLVGKIDPSTFRTFVKGSNYDVDVAAASENGRIEGLNSKIEEQRNTRSKGDGLPQGLSGGGGDIATAPKEEEPKEDIGALNAFSRPSVWGSAKRVKR